MRNDWTRAEIAYLSILPELASGRGTSRRSRVVEGQARRCFGDDPAKHGIRVVEHIRGGNPKCLDAGLLKPSVTSHIVLRPIAKVMSLTVNLDRQTSVAAEEVEDIGTGWMLSSKFEADRALTEPMPDYHFGKGHFAAKPARVRRGSFACFRRNVFQHRAGPSTVLRTVPLPETSSGRI